MLLNTLRRFLVLFVSIWSGIEALEKDAVFLRRDHLDGYMAEDFYLKISKRNRVHCSSICLSDDGCLSFTFAADSGDCFLHDNYSPLPNASHSGAVTFYKKLDHCPETWHLLTDNLCANVYADPITWETALQRCRALGGSLATPDTQEKASLFRAFLSNQSEWNVWTAGNDRAIEGQWIWATTGEALDIAWGPEQPQPFTNENCLAFWDLDWSFHDVSCAYVLRYLCEISL